jgi:hypothetical protein
MFGIDDIVGGVLDIIKGPIATVIDREITDKNAAEKLKGQINLEVAQADIKGVLAQLDINKTEAASSNIFVAGWRPSVGWVCSTALAYQFVVAPIGVWIASILGHPVAPPPKLDDTLWQLMFGMLGMGGLRTFEKVKGVAS